LKVAGLNLNLLALVPGVVLLTCLASLGIGPAAC
jgi:hypothetical protein